MSALPKDTALPKDSPRSQAASRTAPGQPERSCKRTPSPTLKVPKLSSSPSLPGRLKSPNSDPGKDRKPLSVVPRQGTSENSKEFKCNLTNGSSKRFDAVAMFKEATGKAVRDLSVQVVEDGQAVKLGDARSDPLRKTKESSRNLSSELKVAGSEEDSSARRRHKEISPQCSVGSEKKASGKVASPTLCMECRAAAEGAVCFIGNDGRVSACSTRSAVRLCKNINCAANNPEYFAALAAAPKKYLVSKRHLQKAQPSSKIRGGQPKSPRSDQNSESSLSKPDQTDLQSAIAPKAGQNQHSEEKVHDTAASGAIPQRNVDNGASSGDLGFAQDKPPEKLGSQEELEEDHPFVDNDLENGENGEAYSGSLDGESYENKASTTGGEDGLANDKLNGGRVMGDAQKMRRKSAGAIEKCDPETVRLRKQLIQERKQAEEWMLDYAIEETVQKLVPTGEPKVKILVQAFEKLMSHTDEEVVSCSEATRTPENQVPLFRSITFNS